MIKQIITLIFGTCVCFSVFARTGVFPQSSFDELSYGLYWFGADNQYEEASSSTQDGSTYYDPEKPTLILIHGWQNGSITDQDRQTFYEDDSNGWPDKDFANSWISAGYNVGLLYWDQFADESEVKDAEAKIWSTEGNQAMRWIDSEGTYHSGPDQNVTELLLAKYEAAMAGYQGSDIRLAGHSLGNQLALRLADQLVQLADAGDINSNEVPGRVSLLDPFYSNYAKSYLDGEWVGEKAREIVKRLKAADIAIDSYRTSLVTSTLFVGDENTELQNSVAFEEEKTSYFDQTQQSQKHSAAIWLYLWSIEYATPTVSDNTLAGLSATTTNVEVKQWMDTTDHLVQSSGGDTKDPQDNVFETEGAL
ncbi:MULTISPECIES: hypothetical protein [Vibrio]|uniref:Cell adhesion domain-containing protein n=2 Tax=Vibrio TaxID=662 RepID=A0A7X4LMX7_9VIBR|nr:MULTISPECIES: hypothetical protein [Vibrio]MBF9002281.1 hypothetical protein [Vibrio nitrifigilis]MZI94937.1 hypothetical protein [Vibrio eleionomae]